LFSHTKSAPATSQSAVLFSQNKSALAISHSQANTQNAMVKYCRAKKKQWVMQEDKVFFFEFKQEDKSSSQSPSILWAEYVKVYL